jgi:integrase
VSIRKVSWQTRKGTTTAWIASYSDANRKRHHKNFSRKSDADTWLAETVVQVRKGMHVADSASITVQKAGDFWLARCAANNLEPSTIKQYEQHLNLHIVPFIGGYKLSQLNVPLVSAFRDRLHAEGRSQAMVRGVLSSLGSLLAEAQERGKVGHNAVRELRTRRRKGSGQDRHKGKLKVGIDIPTPTEIRTLLAQATGKWRAFLLTAIFSGLRASELRGLLWDNVDLKKGELHVRQRADRWGIMGSPKSAAGERTVPLPPSVVNELREWKMLCPKKDGKLGLVFPNGAGNVEELGNIRKRDLIPAMQAAGIVKPVLDERGVPKRDADGKPIVEAKYSGMHTFRHFFASWCINRKEDGGLGLPAKVVQERLGHSSITMTYDTYGHLFPRGDDKAELAEAEKLLLG